MKKLICITLLAALTIACTKEDPLNPKTFWYGSENYGETHDNAEPKTFEFKNNSLYINGERYYRFVEVQGGSFMMGTDTNNYHGYRDTDETPLHRVTLGTYYIGLTEVSQRFWSAIMGFWTYYNSGNDFPADALSWDDCQVFIQRIHDAYDSVLDGAEICLPTEAQWEFAARGGIMGRRYTYSGSNICANVAWSCEDNLNSSQIIASKFANELGLFDMSGNVKEWCHDFYGEYPSSEQTDPTGPASGKHHVLRGGSYLSPTHECRVSSRSSYPSIARTPDVGCRLVLMKK